MDSQIEQLQKLVTRQEPERADAIVWLQGNMYDRGPKVLELYQQGFAPLIFVSGNNTRVVEDDDIKVKEISQWLQEYGVDKSVILTDDRSMNTHDQAVHVIALAKQRGWNTILLVGSTHHQLRAFLTFLHQTRIQSWSGRIINQPAYIDWDAKPGGRSKIAREAFQEEIGKLGKYKENIVTVEEGIEYLENKQI